MADESKENTLALANLPDKIERKFEEPQLNYWLAELKKAFPEMPEGMLWQTVEQYSTHPHIFDDLMEEHKANPEKFKAKEPEELRYPEWKEPEVLEESKE